MTTLVAVLLNPPLTTGVASLRHVEAARQALVCDSVIVANLFATPTRSVEDINVVGKTACGWTQAREQLQLAISNADLLLGAWGTSGLSGEALRMRKAQVSWLMQTAADEGLEELWTVGGTPRHPSRWHQYVSDKYQRAVGDTLERRLSSVLRSAPINAFG